MMNVIDPSFRGVRTVSSYTQIIDAPPGVVFPLLCPVRESEWVDQWVGSPVFARQGIAEQDGVFATHHADPAGATIWVIAKHDPVLHDLEFVTFVPHDQVFRLSISVRPFGPAQSEVRVTYVRTATSPEGNIRLLARRDANGDQHLMREWELDMNHFLGTGTIRRATAT